MKLPLIKFPRRVRIHGGEFDGSARAIHRSGEKYPLMTYEKALISQAELRIVRGSTNERKQMSTKTLRKRIALVAVSALGFGLMSVVPANATAVATSTISASSTLLTGNVATAISTTYSLIYSTIEDLDELVITPTVVSKPAGATMAADANGTLASGEFATTLTGAAGVFADGAAWDGAVATGVTTYTADAAGAAITTAVIAGTFRLQSAVPGKYVFRLTVGTTANSTVDITVNVIPTAASSTTSLTASVSPSVSVAATDTIITVARNAGGLEADGPILGIVTGTSDATDLPVGTVIGRVSGTTVDLEDNVATAVANTNDRTFTFDNDLSTKALQVKTTTISGTYSFTFWVDANSNGTFDSGEVSTTASYTIQPAISADTGISVSIDNATRANSANVNQFTVTATVADGAAATITESGTSNVTNIIAATSLARVGTSTTYVGTFAVDASPTGDYEDITLTVTSGAYSNTATLRVVTLGDLTTVAGAKALVLNQSTTDTPVGTVTSGVRQTLTAAAAGTITATVDKAYLSHVYTVNAASGQEGEYVKVAVAPTGTTSSTVVAPTYYLAAIGADLVSTVTVAATAPASGSTYSLTVTGTNSVSAAITFTTAAPRWTVSPSADMKAKYGDKSAITGTLSDNYGRVLASKAISVVVTGRNAGTILGTTDAAGAFKVEWTDASTSTVVLTDSLVFNYVYTASSTSTTTSTASSSAYTVTYSATGIAAASMTVSAPSDTTERAIDQIQGSSGAGATSRVNFTATVKDAAGAPVGAGLLVTFAGSSADLFYGGVTTAVTDEFGQATVSVYRKLVGTTAITATAGGLTATAAGIKWSNKLLETASPYTAALTADFHARYVTLTADNAKAVSEGIIRFTAKVTDRFGNAVEGVDVLFSETGAGRFYNAPATTTTNAAGEVSIDLNSQAGETGAVSVSVLISDANARQINDIAGFMTHTTATTTANAAAVTAVSGVTAAVKSATATATIEKSTATSTADALLALAQALGTRDQASATIDAAAEATDAANAATDAANAAAEAADAATAAAQDASDAVAALSAQVSEAIAGLKKQLVSLTNLVIKIQKKVKA